MTAQKITQMGNALAGDLLAWGAAAIGIAMVAAAAMWILRLVGEGIEYGPGRD